MSVSSTAVKIQYTANGVASTFTFPYYFISATDLVVKLDGVLQTLGADYTLEPILLSFSSGGRVIFTSVPALNQEVAIIRVVPAKQETDYANLTEFRAEVFEADLDKRALVEQQLAEQLSRAIVFPDTEVPALTVLPVASERAGQAIMFDMAGDMILGGIGSYPASAWAQTLLDDVDASAGLSTLGFSSWAKTFIDDLDGPAAQTTLGVSAFIKTLLDDADAATARATLSAVPVPTITQKSTDYVMADVAWCEVVNCTTGAGLLTVTLPTLADNQGSHVIVIKDKDSGAGEVMVDGEGAELLMYPGFTAAVGYVGLAGQSAEFVGMPDGWQYISGVVQPVAGEPNVGGGLHWISYANTSNTLLVDAIGAAQTWSAAVTVPNVPAGVRAAYCLLLRWIQTYPDALVVAPASGWTLSTDKYRYPGVFNNAGGVNWMGYMTWVPLDSSLQFKWMSVGGVVKSYVGPAVAYDL